MLKKKTHILRQRNVWDTSEVPWNGLRRAAKPGQIQQPIREVRERERDGCQGWSPVSVMVCLSSNTVVQLCVQRRVHVVDGVHRRRVVDQKLAHVGQTLVLRHHLALRQGLEEIGLVWRRDQRRLQRKDHRTTTTTTPDKLLKGSI